MYVDPGDLKKKIQIIQLLDGETYDKEGLPVKEEVLVRSCWAKVSNTSGTELIKAGSELSEGRTRFLIRYASTSITTAMVVRFLGDDYNILYVNSYGDNREYVEIWTELKKREV